MLQFEQLCSCWFGEFVRFMLCLAQVSIAFEVAGAARPA